MPLGQTPRGLEGGGVASAGRGGAGGGKPCGGHVTLPPGGKGGGWSPFWEAGGWKVREEKAMPVGPGHPLGSIPGGGRVPWVMETSKARLRMLVGRLAPGSPGGRFRWRPAAGVVRVAF